MYKILKKYKKSKKLIFLLKTIKKNDSWRLSLLKKSHQDVSSRERGSPITIKRTTTTTWY